MKSTYSGNISLGPVKLKVSGWSVAAVVAISLIVFAIAVGLAVAAFFILLHNLLEIATTGANSNNLAWAIGSALVLIYMVTYRAPSSKN